MEAGRFFTIMSSANKIEGQTKLLGWFLNRPLPPGNHVTPWAGDFDLKGKEIMFLARYKNSEFGVKHIAKELGVSSATGFRFVKSLGLSAKMHASTRRRLAGLKPICAINRELTEEQKFERLWMEELARDKRILKWQDERVRARSFLSEYVVRSLDPKWKVVSSLRRRMNKLIKRGKAGSTRFSSLSDCSPAEMVIWIQSKFTGGMTWANHGQWHIDHVRPIASFDLYDPVQVSACMHFTNLQPLWAKDNLVKSDTWTG